MQPNLIFVELWQFTYNGLYQQIHQGIDFFFRSIPVFGGKRIKGKEFHAAACGRFESCPNRLNTVRVAEDALSPLAFSPTPIAVHNDGDVPWNPCFVDLVK
jgi:hypothetical protein